MATPRGGGLGPVAGFAVAIVVAGINGWIPEADWRWLLASLLAVAGIGAWDDHRPLGAGPRLLVHVLAGAALAAAFDLWTREAVLAVAVMAGAVVLINAWNFMDGIDGIASTQAAIVGLTSLALADGGWKWLSLAFVLVLLAFLPFNFPRARIFLGDVGSGALGLVVIMLAAPRGDPAVWPSSLLLSLPASAFVTDVALTLGRRALRGERWWTAHTQHAYQVLARRHGHVPITIAYGLWSAAGLVAALLLAAREAVVMLMFVGLWYMACAALWAFLQHRWARRSEAA